MVTEKQPGMTKYGNPRFKLAELIASKAEAEFRDLTHLANARLAQLNRHLLDLSKRIADLQPKKPGAVTLELSRCGPKLCFGCPHPKWRIWFAPQGHALKEKRQLLASASDSAGVAYTSGMIRKRLKRTGDFEPVYQTMLALIAQVEHLVEDRKAIYSVNLSSWHQRKSRWETELSDELSKRKAAGQQSREAVPNPNNLPSNP